MEDLLESFDPLHSGKGSNSSNSKPLFEDIPPRSNGSVNGGAGGRVGVSLPTAPVSLSAAPLPVPSLDLLSLDAETANDDAGGSRILPQLQREVAVRQQATFEELARADLPTSASSAIPISPPSHRRRPSWGVPRRRLSSGSNSLMGTPALIDVNGTPSDLFHPSSPPEGTSLDSLRSTSNSYFSSASLGRTTAGKMHNTGRSGSNGYAGWQSQSQPVASGSGTSSVNSSSFPNIDNSDLFAHSTRSSKPRSNIPSASSTFPSDLGQPASPPKASRTKPSKRAHTFDFPTTSSLGTSSSSSSASTPFSRPPIPVPIARSSSPVYPQASGSLAIDSEPLPALILKSPASVSTRNRILSEDLAEAIRPALSSRLRLCRSWSLLYSLDAHGTSLSTLCARVQAGLAKSAGGCVLCLRDMEGAVFGGYVNEPFVRREGYFGNGECFLWRSVPLSPSDFRVGPLVRHYRWTGANDYMILSDSPSFLSIGGGNGTFGLWLDASFEKGFSTTCPTFANEVLCSEKYARDGVDGRKEGRFEVMAVECWAVG